MGNHHPGGGSDKGKSASKKEKTKTIPPGLECPICHDLFTFPVFLSCCGRSSCKKCVSNLKACPLCKEKFPKNLSFIGNKDLEKVCTQERSRQHVNVSLPAKNPNDKAPLLRQASTGKLCVICQDTDCMRGLACYSKAKHFVCLDCFPQYVKSICENGGKFRDLHYTIRCPVPDCADCEPWTTQDVTAGLLASDNSKEILDIFIATLATAADKSDQTNNPLFTDTSGDIKADIQRLIAEALCLKCPSRYCQKVLDPDPDGCCAMRCVHCGVHFCWLCFAMQDTSQTSHAHVRRCEHNPSKGNVFLHTGTKVSAHRLLRLEYINIELNRRFTVEWRKNEAVTQAIRTCDTILKGTDVSTSDIIKPFTRNIRQRDGEPPNTLPPNTVRLICAVGGVMFLIGWLLSSWMRPKQVVMIPAPSNSTTSIHTTNSTTVATTTTEPTNLRIYYLLFIPIWYCLVYIAVVIRVPRIATLQIHPDIQDLGIYGTKAALVFYHLSYLLGDAVLFIWFGMFYAIEHVFFIAFFLLILFPDPPHEQKFACMVYYPVSLLVDLVIGSYCPYRLMYLTLATAAAYGVENIRRMRRE
jgi:hypothetical protein